MDPLLETARRFHLERNRKGEWAARDFTGLPSNTAISRMLSRF